MTYLSQEQAVKLAQEAQLNNSPVIDYPAVTLHYKQVEWLCNAAIAHYLSSMGEGLLEPIAYVMAPSKNGPIAMTCPVAKLDKLAGMHDAPLFTREQMIQYGIAQREKALEEAATEVSYLAESSIEPMKTVMKASAEMVRFLKGKQWQQDGKTDSAKTTTADSGVGSQIGSDQESNSGESL
jgi:hypothetical protein